MENPTHMSSAEREAAQAAQDVRGHQGTNVADRTY